MPPPESIVVTPHLLRDWPLPDPSGGKEARGSILVIGGSAETLGAVVLAAEAALRAGAGKLQVATAGSVAPFAALARPEALVRGLPETDGGAIRADGVEAIRELAEAADAVLFGPGMTDKEQTQEFGQRLLALLSCPTVVDALGLACVTEDAGCVHHLGEQVVLTPNPSELALSLHLDQSEVDDDEAGAARELASRARATVGLGGVTSWMAAPDGRLWRGGRGGNGVGVSRAGDVRAGVTARPPGPRAD